MAIVGDTAAGVFLSQLIYWTRRGVDVMERDGWVFKTAQDWQHETGLSWKVQRRARSRLLALDLLEERKQLMPARLEFRLKLSTLTPLLASAAQIETCELDLAAFRDRHSGATDDLLGRAFLFHGVLNQLFPVHAATLCSRLLSPSRLPVLDATALRQAGDRGTGVTRLVAMHRAAWRSETGLSRDQWQTARRHLREAGVLIERRRNFPRRVDLAIDTRALAALLHQAGAANGRDSIDGHDRQDRAKQASGDGPRPMAPCHSPQPSPDAADKDRPIQPLGISRSRLYLLGLQEGVHPQPQDAWATSASRRAHPVCAAFGWGGGGTYSIVQLRMQPLKREPQSRCWQTPQAPALMWPSFFGTADREQALVHLAALEPPIQQAVLDEIDWVASTGREVRSPVALARTLCRKAHTGEFHPDGAHRIAQARADLAAAAAKRRAEATQRATPTDGAATARLDGATSTLDEEIRNRLARIRRRAGAVR